MILKAYSLLDVKTGLYSAPWFLNHHQTAIRAIKQLCRQKDNTIAEYPTDYALYCIGEFDDNAGILMHSPLDLIGVVASLLAQD